MKYLELLDKYWNNFDSQANLASNKQIDFLIRQNNNIDNINFYGKNLDISNLKYYQLPYIINNELYINKEDKNVLKYYFKNNLLNDISNIVTDIDYDVSNNILNKLKVKHIKKIYQNFPKLNYIKNKFNLLSKFNDIPIIYNDKFEYGIQLKNNDEKFYYIKFYDWCTIDIDIDDFNYVDNMLNNYINNNNNYIFCLYKSYNGYHIHIMNKKIKYNSHEYKLLSIVFNNDIWYYNYTINNGYKLRLSKKNTNDFIIRFIKYYIPKNISNDMCCLYDKTIYDKFVNNFV